MSYLSPEAYLPHDAPMLLLESVEMSRTTRPYAASRSTGKAYWRRF
jgi:predicted hotdog family 3-hydroxylacyl-ACP dehydratase